MSNYLSTIFDSAAKVIPAVLARNDQKKADTRAYELESKKLAVEKFEIQKAIEANTLQQIQALNNNAQTTKIAMWLAGAIGAAIVGYAISLVLRSIFKRGK